MKKLKLSTIILYLLYSKYTRWLKSTEKVSFHIASEASYVCIMLDKS